MKIKQRNKVTAALVCAFLLSMIYPFFVYKSPEQLASDAKYIPQFFGLTESDFWGFDGEISVIDEIHSQGRKWGGDFGSAHYEIEIRLCEIHPNVRKEIKAKGGVYTDSTWVLIKRKGDIRGEFVVKHNSSNAHVYYYHIYD